MPVLCLFRYTQKHKQLHLL